MAAKELLAPVPSAEEHSVSVELWQRLEDEIKAVSARIKADENLVPEDVATFKKLKAEVDSYVADFNRAMRNSQKKYKKMVEERLDELGFNVVEQYVLKKRTEQTAIQNARIKCKMDYLKELLDLMIAKTKRLKDLPLAKELLPAFVARFPQIQSGAKNNDIKDWKPYFAVMSKVITVMDTFFCDPKYEDAIFLPIYSETMREFLAYAKDGRKEHLANIPVKFKEDGELIRTEKLKSSLKSEADGIERIRMILNDMEDLEDETDAVKQLRTKQAWEKISEIVRLCNIN